MFCLVRPVVQVRSRTFVIGVDTKWWNGRRAVDDERGVVGCRRAKWWAAAREGSGKYQIRLHLNISSQLTVFSKPCLSKPRCSSVVVHVRGSPSVSSPLSCCRLVFSELRECDKRELKRSVVSQVAAKVRDERTRNRLSSWLFCAC